MVPKLRDGSSPGGGAKTMEIFHRLFYLQIMTCYVYIIQSEKTNGYYIGQTDNVELRLRQHNAQINPHFTFRDRPWVLKTVLECVDRKQAMKVEYFIKKQKSRVFIEKIIRSEEVRQSLISKFC